MDVSILFGGVLAGITQTIVGHPFDTIKVRYIKENHKTIYGCINNVRKDGYRYFYKGALSPTVSSVLMNVQTFYLYENINKHIHNYFISGAVTGILLSFTESPTDLIKSRLQINPKSNYNQIIKELGIKNIYKGFNICMYRNILSTGLYFSTYHNIKNYYYIQNNNHNIGYLIGGIGAGLMSWAPTYPLDNIKTRIQTDVNNKYKGIIDCTIKIIKTEKYRGFYNGFIPCIVRSIIVNPFIFFAYEYGISILNS